MTEAGVKTPVPLDELESHLRDAVEDRIRVGLTEAQAFDAATQQLGHAIEIKSEFQKVAMSKLPWGHKWGDRYGLWVVACLNGLYIAVWMCHLFVYPFFSGSERALGFVGLAAMSLGLFAGCLLIPRVWPVFDNERIESALVSMCVISGAAWFAFFGRFILPRFEFTPGELRVAILWASIPAMVTPTFFLSIRKRERSENSPIAP
jgi:hypothetical protein